ncbi:MAG TPA: TRAP transporter TatT component family protein [Kiritimatiellia bacterium]|nr:TRAP transporter TatT component family protein [Kiritimatiellia bacterium]HSA19654.1 TRAP transporter TatT component family protein [Kiritimatiellia bacterium]
MNSRALLLVLALGAAGPGCALVRSGVGRAMAPMAEDLAASLQQQSDVELVREGAPAYLLLLDGLADSGSRQPRILLAAAEANTSYAMAFLDQADRERAKAFHARARDYGLDVLRRNRKFRAAERAPLMDFEAAVRTFRRRDVPALFTTGTAWINWILASSDSVEALAQLGRAVALMQRVLELEPDYRKGSAHLFFGLYYAVQPLGAGRDMEKAQGHFQRVFELAGPDYLIAKVTYAEYYARYAFDRALFESTLREVLAPREDPAEYRLMNAVARLRAQALLDRVEEFF